MKAIKNIITAILCLGILVACSKNTDGTGTSPSGMRVKMKDAPGDFQKVYIEITAVQMHYVSDNMNDTNRWVNIKTNAGVYDLLLLQNGTTEVIADDANIPPGKIDKMRLVLGSRNSVIIDGISFNLRPAISMQKDLAFDFNKFLRSHKKYEAVIDFDAKQSIIADGFGGFTLKPSIKLESVTEN